MKRDIIKIDEAACNGCGLCVSACHEGALQLIDGKARLISESYCDGLGNCLPECPTGAIVIEKRETVAFDEEAVKQHMNKTEKPEQQAAGDGNLPCGCPGSLAKVLTVNPAAAVSSMPAESVPEQRTSQLGQWPCQIKLAPVSAPYFDQAHLLIAADCTAYAYAGMHQTFMRGKITLIGCPKLDDVDYSLKLTEILKQHDLKSLTIVKMEVPCCGGILQSVKKGLANSGKMIPWNVVTISTDGKIIEE